MMKTISGAFAAVLLLLTQPAAAQLKVFACEAEWAALASALGGDNVDVYAATTALQDVHKIQPRPSLIAKYRKADLLVCTGAELELGWLPQLIEKGNNAQLNPGAPGNFEASRYVTMLEIPAKIDRAQGDVHPYGNPHIQTDPRNIGKVAKPLADKLAELDPAHAADYARRYQDFNTRWTAAVDKWTAAAAPLKGVPVISGHKAWAYLYDWLGIREVATLEAKPGIPPSGAHLQELLGGLKTQPAKMIVYAAYQDHKPIEWMAEHSGLPTAELPFSPGGAKGTDNDLFATFDVTVQRLLDAAKQSPQS
ncbi:metal ABC transporter substrate-binding protein [Sinimarinibacterium sp. CAU 1509]|uniref:metal ABC transporter substrate-binding protein n=1 Tax=Sinimarinibacterium sp. CAU 1509 TaxID=2562283 RepID=UPI001B7F7CD7|nr:zinc ABC transporter substrate-binding protein [Sinimarinibacterium sp. CAU 1509]